MHRNNAGDFAAVHSFIHSGFEVIFAFAGLDPFKIGTVFDFTWSDQDDLNIGVLTLRKASSADDFLRSVLAAIGLKADAHTRPAVSS